MAEGRQSVRQEALHQVVVEFDDGVYAKRLIHPDAGCQQATSCGHCGRDYGDPEREGCYDCKGVVPSDCWIQDWFDDQGVDLLRGEVTVNVEAEWTGDGCLLHIVPEKAVAS